MKNKTNIAMTLSVKENKRICRGGALLVCSGSKPESFYAKVYIPIIGKSEIKQIDIDGSKLKLKNKKLYPVEAG